MSFGSEAGMIGDKTFEMKDTVANGTSTVVTAIAAEHNRDDSFWARHGLTIGSFGRRHYGTGIVELERPIKPRHLNMIAMGGSVGAGFFISSGGALYDGGPGSVLIDFIIVGIMVFNVVYALGELAVMYPISGSFYTYSTRFIDPSWGFAMGWNYVLQWLAVLPLELTIACLTMQYWSTNISIAVWITVFLVLIVIISVFGALGYAEEEFTASTFKLVATVVFIIVAFVLVLGGGPEHGRYSEYWGARYWYEPGAFKNGFKGFCSVFVSAAFSFSGTELVGLAAAEARNPVQVLPRAIKQVFWRVTLFFILGLTFIGFLISSNDENLLSDSFFSDTHASPFVLVGKYAGLTGFDSFMNAVILVSVLSIGVSSVFGASRTLLALAQQGYAPKLFTYVDQAGRPLPAVGVCLLSGLIAYISLTTTGAEIFNWLLAISGLAALFTWSSICLAHIRFRQAWAYNGHSLDEIPFKAVGGVVGSWIGLGINGLVLISQFYTAISAPPGESGLNDIQGFFSYYLAVPVVLLFWAIGWIWKREGWLKVSEIDIETDRRELDWDEIHSYRQHIATLPAWRRFIHYIT